MPRRCTAWAVTTLLVASLSFAQSEANRFAVAGISEHDARSLLGALQSALRSDDRDKGAELVEFPLRVNRSGTHKMLDRSEFLSNFSNIFSTEVRQQVLAQNFETLFANWQGVMLGNGTVWFSGICDPDSPVGTCKNVRVRIYAINLDAAR